MNVKRFLSDSYRRQIDHKINKLVINHQINQKHTNRPQTTQAKSRCVNSVLSPLPSLSEQKSSRNSNSNNKKPKQIVAKKKSNQITFEVASEIYKMKCQDLNLKPNETAEKRFIEQFMNSIFPKSMRLSGLGLGPTCITKICKILLKNQQFVYLDLSMNRLKEEGAKILKMYLELNPPTIFLNLKSNSIGITGSSLIFKSLENNYHLTSLDLGAVDGIDRNRLGTQGCRALGNMLLRNQTISNLNLSMCGITADGCQFIGDSLTQNTSLFSLDLTSNRFGSVGINNLFKDDGSFGRLGTLILSRNGIGNDASNTICRQIRMSESIRSIDLSNNDLSKPFLERLYATFQEGTKISRLSLSKNKFGPESADLLQLIIKDTRSLTYFDLSSNNFKDEGLISIAKGLKQNTSLTTVDLSETGMTDKSGIEFAQVISLHPFLQKFYLAENSLSDVSGIEIANSLCQNKTLVVLSLSNNELRDDSAYALLEALNINSTIADLNVDFNDFGPDSYVDLAKKIEEHKQILNSNVAELAMKKIDWLKEEEGRLFQYREDIKDMQNEVASAMGEFETKENELSELCSLKQTEIDEMNQEYEEIMKKHDQIVEIKNEKTREHKQENQKLEKKELEAHAQLKNLKTQRQIMMVNRNRKKDSFNQMKTEKEKELNELLEKKKDLQERIKFEINNILMKKKEMIDKEEEENKLAKKKRKRKDSPKKKKKNAKKKNSQQDDPNNDNEIDNEVLPTSLKIADTNQNSQSAAVISASTDSTSNFANLNYLQSTPNLPSFQKTDNIFVSQLDSSNTKQEAPIQRPKRPNPDDQRNSNQQKE